MNPTSLEIWHDDARGGKLVGLLFGNPGRGGSGLHLAFQYDAGWLVSPEAFAIDPVVLPLARAPFHSNELFSALQDTGPDRWGCLLIEKKTARAGGRLTTLDYLLGLADHTRIGALRYRWRGEQQFRAPLDRPVPPLLKINRLLYAADAVEAGKEQDEDLILLLGSGSPPGGARPKATVVDDDGTLAIAKFPRRGNEDSRSIPKGEVLALTLAKKAGITAATARLVCVRRRHVAIIRRFDRAGERRIPFISARTLLGMPKDQDGSYLEIAEAIRQHGATPLRDLAELWRRLVFSRLVSNFDDHLRNHAFIRPDARGWQLAPAYDINPVPAVEHRLHTATPVAPSQPGGVALAIEFCEAFGLNLTQARHELRRVVGAVKKWDAEGLLTRQDARDYASAFENDERIETEKILATHVSFSDSSAAPVPTAGRRPESRKQ